ncbi:MAG TPA: lactonase family protein [Luteitalea sp.]|nr:lactonase family protein [Luteitalea sp.]
MPNPVPSRRAFLTQAAGVAVSAPVMAGAGQRAAQQSAPLFAYVGTYTTRPDAKPRPDPPSNNGRGIHIFRVDRMTGGLTPVGVAEHPTSPSALAFGAGSAYLYSTNASDEVDDRTSGSVSAFKVDHATGQLTLLNTVSSGGLGPTYAFVHPAGRHLFVANYGGGSVAVLPIGSDGRLSAATDVKKTTGTLGPRRATSAPPGSFAWSGHDAPHAHMIATDAAGRFVLAPDLGLDRIFVWEFDATRGTLSPAAEPSVAVPPGDGARHFAFHPNQKWLYAIQEEGSTVIVFDYDGSRGGLTPRQTVSTLPKGYAGSNFCSGILVSQDGRYLYAANRLHDSIAIFAIGKDGTLTAVADEWTRGDYPRSLAVDPTGRFMYALNQRADHVATFRVDARRGTLTFTGQYTAVGSPSDMVFLDTAVSNR